jgi:hypothetical protein
MRNDAKEFGRFSKNVLIFLLRYFSFLALNLGLMNVYKAIYLLDITFVS